MLSAVAIKFEGVWLQNRENIILGAKIVALSTIAATAMGFSPIMAFAQSALIVATYQVASDCLDNLDCLNCLSGYELLCIAHLISCAGNAAFFINWRNMAPQQFWSLIGIMRIAQSIVLIGYNLNADSDKSAHSKSSMSWPKFIFAHAAMSTIPVAYTHLLATRVFRNLNPLMSLCWPLAFHLGRKLGQFIDARFKQPNKLVYHITQILSFEVVALAARRIAQITISQSLAIYGLMQLGDALGECVFDRLEG